MNILSFLSTLGIACSVIGNIGPILAVQEKLSSKQNDQIPWNFLLLNHITQFLWLLYGLKAELPGVAVVNFFTTILTLVCLVMVKRSTNSLLLFMPTYLVFLSLSTVTCFLIMNLKLFGSLCTILGIVSFGAALESVMMVVKTGNYLFIDLKIASNIMACSIVWGLFGYYSGDLNVIVVNIFGVLVGFVLFSVYFYYGSRKIFNKFHKLFRPNYAFVL